MLEVSHNALALVGLVVVAVVLFASGLTDLRHTLESQAYNWLQARQEARTLAENGSQGLASLPGDRDAISRATASDPKDLNRQQAAVAFWLARRYRVAIEPMSRLVQEAWDVGHSAGIEPTLILAVMAVESSFNPFAQSNVGAQGLMQVMTKIHDDKYVAFGGSHAAFDPVTNLRVGVQVLKECIARAGGLEAGLRFYVGAANTGEDGGYAAKVLAQQSILRQIAAGTMRQTPRPATEPVPTGPALRAVAPPPALPDQIALLP
ncbi:MAG: lytic transglycosylase domain-containing protein [Caldimonas sp.]